MSLTMSVILRTSSIFDPIKPTLNAAFLAQVVAFWDMMSKKIVVITWTNITMHSDNRNSSPVIGGHVQMKYIKNGAFISKKKQKPE